MPATCSRVACIARRYSISMRGNARRAWYSCRSRTAKSARASRQSTGDRPISICGRAAHNAVRGVHAKFRLACTLLKHTLSKILPPILRGGPLNRGLRFLPGLGQEVNFLEKQILGPPSDSTNGLLILTNSSPSAIARRAAENLRVSKGWICKPPWRK